MKQTVLFADKTCFPQRCKKPYLVICCLLLGISRPRRRMLQLQLNSTIYESEDPSFLFTLISPYFPRLDTDHSLTIYHRFWQPPVYRYISCREQGNPNKRPIISSTKKGGGCEIKARSNSRGENFANSAVPTIDLFIFDLVAPAIGRSAFRADAVTESFLKKVIHNIAGADRLCFHRRDP